MRKALQCISLSQAPRPFPWALGPSKAFYSHIALTEARRPVKSVRSETSVSSLSPNITEFALLRHS